MSYTALQLVSDSWYISNIVSKDLETVSGEQETSGLQMLNDVLAIKTADNRLVPYYEERDLISVPGQETYFIPGCINIESFTYFIGPVRFAVVETPRRQYNSSPRVEGINSLAFIWTQVRTFGGANLMMYFNPGADYPIKIWGKFSLANVTLNQDLSLTLDAFYLEYLRFALAERMCAEYNVSVPQTLSFKLKSYELMVLDIGAIDLSMKKFSSFNKQPSLNWALVNIPGWVP